VEDFPLKINLSSYFPILKDYLFFWSHSWSLNKNFSPEALKFFFKGTTPDKYSKDLTFPKISHSFFQKVYLLWSSLSTDKNHSFYGCEILRHAFLKNIHNF